jgi:hypothetical protein
MAATAEIDRSKRYDKPVHPDKQGGGTSKKATGEAESKAEETAGKPPSAEKPEGAIHKPDKGPESGHGPAFGEVAERHKREVMDTHKRHSEEVEHTMGGIHERHAKEIKDMGARHGKEISEHWESQTHHPEGGGSPGKAKGGEGPKLGKETKESDKGEAMKGDKESPKLGATKEEGKGGTEP